MGLMSVCCQCCCYIVILILGVFGLLCVKPVNDALTVYSQKNMDHGGALATVQTLQNLAGMAKCFELPVSKPMLIACVRLALPLSLYEPAHGWGGDGVGIKSSEPGGHGFFVYTHKAITSYQNQPDLVRDPDTFIASSVSSLWESKGLVPPGFFPLVINMNTDSPERMKRRNFMNEIFPALMNPPELDIIEAATHAGLTKSPWILTDAVAAERLVSCVLYKALFGVHPPNEILDLIHYWADNAKPCAIGRCQPWTSGPRVWDVFQQILGNIEGTAVGKKYLKSAAEYGFDDPHARLREMIFITNFAGVGGTSDNVGAALYKIHKDEKMRPLFWQNPDDFVKEAARLYPGVAGMLTKNNIDRTLTMGNGRVVQAPAAQEFYTWNSAGNIDPTVFGGPSKSQDYAMTFDPSRPNLDKMLTFNAEVGNILACNTTAGCPGSAARPCPGTRLALKITVEVLKYVLTVTNPIRVESEL